MSSKPSLLDDDRASFTAPLTTPSPVSIDPHQTFPLPPPGYHPILVALVVRHGARTPILFLPDQTREEYQKIWGNCHSPRDADERLIPCPRGALTTTGEQQLLSLGQAFAQRYRALLDVPSSSQPVIPPNVYLRSTNTYRTRLSLSRFVQGIYPSLTQSDISPKIVIRSESTEFLAPNYRFCDRLRQYFAESLSSNIYQQVMTTDTITSLLPQFMKHTQTHYPSGPESRPYIAYSDEIKCRQAHNINLPNNFTQNNILQMNSAAEWIFHHILQYNKQTVRLGIGSFLQEFHTQILDRINIINHHYQPSYNTNNQNNNNYNNNTDMNDDDEDSSSYMNPIHHKHDNVTNISVPSVLIYCGHDSTIVPMMNAFGISRFMQNRWPPFASNILVEVLQRDDLNNNDNNEYINGNSINTLQVRLSYNGEVATIVPFNEWETRIKSFFLKDRQQECMASKDRNIPLPDQVW